MSFKTQLPNAREQIAEAIIARMNKDGLVFLDEVARRQPPHNPISGVQYRGMNWLSLTIKMTNLGAWQDSRFCTFKQAVDAGWNIRKGASGAKIFFYSPRSGKYHRSDSRTTKEATPEQAGETEEGKSEQSSKIRSWVCAAFSVFHASDVVGIHPVPPALLEPIQKSPESELLLQAFLAETNLQQRVDSPAYCPSTHTLVMPPQEGFYSNGAYYATLHHELVHATGGEKFLNRFSQFTKADNFTVQNPEEIKERRELYAREEFVAELGSAMLCAEFGIPDYDKRMNNSSAYIKDYLQQFDGDTKEIYNACKQASAACDFCIDLAIGYAQKLGVLQDYPKLAEIAAREKPSAKEIPVSENSEISQSL